MRITASQLHHIIKEEVGRVFVEAAKSTNVDEVSRKLSGMFGGDPTDYDAVADVIVLTLNSLRSRRDTSNPESEIADALKMTPAGGGQGAVWEVMDAFFPDEDFGEPPIISGDEEVDDDDWHREDEQHDMTMALVRAMQKLEEGGGDVKQIVKMIKDLGLEYDETEALVHQHCPTEGQLVLDMVDSPSFFSGHTPVSPAPPAARRGRAKPAVAPPPPMRGPRASGSDAKLKKAMLGYFKGRTGIIPLLDAIIAYAYDNGAEDDPEGLQNVLDTMAIELRYPGKAEGLAMEALGY